MKTKFGKFGKFGSVSAEIREYLTNNPESTVDQTVDYFEKKGRSVSRLLVTGVYSRLFKKSPESEIINKIREIVNSDITDSLKCEFIRKML